MNQYSWSKITSLLILLLPIEETTAYVSLIVRDGDDATLPPANVIDGEKKCAKTNWIIGEKDLVKNGQVVARSERVRITADCSLVIKNVTQGDVGVYHYQQSDSQRQETQNDLSVLKLTEQKDGGWVSLSCLVSAFGCRHMVNWLIKAKQEATEKHGYSACDQTVRFPTSLFNQSTNYLDLFTCEVEDAYNKKKYLFGFRPQSSGDKPVEETSPPARTTVSSKIPRTNSADSASATTSPPTPQTEQVPSWLLYVIAPVGSVALLIIILIIIILKRSKGNKTKMADSTGQSMTSAVPLQTAAETSQDTVEPEDEVSYASVSYKKSISKAQVKHDEDEQNEVTYSTVRTSTSVRASADPSNIYAAVKNSKNP